MAVAALFLVFRNVQTIGNASRKKIEQIAIRLERIERSRPPSFPQKR